MSLLTFLDRFPTEEACLAHLEGLRWPDGPVCPKCGAVGNAGRTGKPRYWQCRACRQHFTVLHGTPLEGTHLPLRAWFAAVYLVAASSKGIAATRLAEQIGVTYKTAWYLGHRLRRMMQDEDFILRGVVEADETYLGGKRRKGEASKRDKDDDQPKGRGGSRKVMVAVAVEREGRAKAKKAGTHSEMSLANFVRLNVDLGSVLCTDELPAYRWIGSKFPAHLTVNHSADEWVRRDPHAAADAHTNTAESFNATVKRAIIGVWHWFSIKHSDRYLCEIGFRWNRRKTKAEARVADMLGTAQGRLRWRECVA